EEKLERIKEETIAVFRNVAEAGGGSLEVEVKDVAPGVNLSTEHATVKLATAAAQKLNFPVSTGFTGGCSDANFLCGMGLPTVLLATGMDKIHTTEERLALEDLNNAARWVLGIVQEATAQAQGKF
ncbi:MAG: M20/M25/M40 family metallo-hydrolase, partial [Acidaminococcaceae bacterium]|nr:M20/M25/M40 family metallo-hydrolase [Acidaminococcaceae bacterium]